MKRWHLPSLEQSSDKRTERAPGADAPRVPSTGHQKPRLLFSSPECRAVVLDLQSGHDLGDHHVRERAVVQVISGRVSITTSHETIGVAPPIWSGFGVGFVAIVGSNGGPGWHRSGIRLSRL